MRERLKKIRHLLATVTAAALFVIALGAETSRALDAPDGTLGYQIWRNGEKVGTYKMTLHHRGSDLYVENEIEIVVRVLFVPVYRYFHRDQEIWRNGQFAELVADTNDDGKGSMVDVRPTTDGLLIEGTAGRYVAPAGILPSSLWKIDMTTASRVLDVENGKTLAVHFAQGPVEPIFFNGQDTPARLVSVTGDLSRELWYGADNLLLRERFAAPDGSMLDFRRERN